MSRRRVFRIDMPEEEAAPAAPRAPAARPGPMASAVRENAEAKRARRSLEQEIRAENDALAHEHVRLKAEGLVLQRIPLAAIDAARLTRDRSAGVDPELEELMASIRELGLSNPIRVERHGERYELIQGFRRLSAYRALHAETGDPAFAAIPAAMAPAEKLETAYRRMVDENHVRTDISFAEMAELARAYAAHPEVGGHGVEKAVAALFRSASYQKRSYIRSFAALLQALDGRLKHGPAIPRNLGLAVRRRIEEEGAEELIRALEADPERDAAGELAILRGFAADADLPEDPEAEEAGREDDYAPAPEAPPAALTPPQGGPDRRLSFRLTGPAGETRCTAAPGRLELRGPTDFAAVEQPRLERALAAFYAALDEG